MYTKEYYALLFNICGGAKTQVAEADDLIDPAAVR